MKYPTNAETRLSIQKMIKSAERETIKYLILSILLTVFVGYNLPEMSKLLVIAIPALMFTLLATIVNFSYSGVLHQELNSK